MVSGKHVTSYTATTIQIESLIIVYHARLISIPCMPVPSFEPYLNLTKCQ